MQPTIDQPTEDEVAAALAAVQALLSDEQAQPSLPALDDGWHHSGKLAVQQVRPAKTRVVPRWQTIERLRRAIGGRYDVGSF